tara:strand:+ start:2848 stop:3510 length:663 start_codon:yes stop_codon:yes gene_type:complete
MDKTKILLDYLSQFLTDERKVQLNKVIDQRTNHFAVALENIYQPHNSNAVIRSCDCFGIQDCHVIETINEFRFSKNVSKGATKWINVHRHKGTTQAISALRREGYQIVATTPHTDDCNLEDFDVSKKSVFFFGAEKRGLSQTVLNEADVFLKIPMVGHTESLNISVSAAIILQHVSRMIREENIAWQLTTEEKETLRLSFTKSSTKRLDDHLKVFEKSII